MTSPHSPKVVVSLPDCPKYVAHPQSVWFEEHWRPIFDKLQAALKIYEGPRLTSAGQAIKKLQEDNTRLRIALRNIQSANGTPFDDDYITTIARNALEVICE